MAFPLVSARYPHPSSTVSTIGFGRFAIARQNTWIHWTNHFVSVTIFAGAFPWLMQETHVSPPRGASAPSRSTTEKSFATALPSKLSRKWQAFSGSTKTSFSPYIVPPALHPPTATSPRFLIVPTFPPPPPPPFI